MKPLRTTAVALLATAATAATPAVASAASTDASATNCTKTAHAFFLGLGGNDSLIDSGSANCIITQQIKVGAGVLRQGMLWSDIERTPGQYTWGYYDTWMRAAATHRMRVLPVLAAPPTFRAKTVGSYMSPPTSYSSYGNFVAAVARRYGRNGSFWAENPTVPAKPITSFQIWNEPNLPQYWGGKPDAKKYAKLLKAASTALHKVDRKADVVTAGMPESLIKHAIPASKFVPKLYKAKAAKSFDTLAINAYAPTAKGVASYVKKMRGIMLKNRDRKGHTWVTEVGWGTGGPKHRFNIGKRAQAKQLKLLLKGLYKTRKKMNLRGVVYYDWEDRLPYGPEYKDQWGLHTGLLDIHGRPKPSFKLLEKLGPKLK